MTSECRHYFEDVEFVSCEQMGLSLNSYAQMPTPQLEGEFLKVFFSSRNLSGQSVPHQVTLDSRNFRVAFKAIPLEIPFGELGSFDLDGLMPSSVISISGDTHLYYVGWIKGNSTPYQLGIGLAKKLNGLDDFTKVGLGPILDRSLENPFFVTTPHVFPVQGGYKMLFSSGRGWKKYDSRVESLYGVKEAYSSDGINWSEFKKVNFGESVTECIARPFYSNSHIYISRRDAFDFRKSSKGYRIEVYAHQIGMDLTKCVSLWNDEIQDHSDRAYSSIIEIEQRRFVLYNGTSFGKHGFHVAEEVIRHE